MSHDIFIAHKEVDFNIALEIAIGLEEAGYSTWTYEADDIAGISYLRQINKAITEARVIIVVISPNSIDSRQVTNEIVKAHETGKYFIPVRKGISYDDFQNSQPEWQLAFGAAHSIEIVEDGTEDVIQPIIDGVKARGIEPQPEVDRNHIEKIHKALDKKRKLSAAGKAGKPEEPAEQPKKPVEPIEELPKPIEEPVKHDREREPSVDKKRKKSPRTIGIAAGAGIIIIIVLVILFTVVLGKHSLDIMVSPLGGGTVSPASGGYDADSTITLAAKPAEGYGFDRWSGDITGTSVIARLTMDSDKSVIAYFNRQYPLDVSVSPLGCGTVSPACGGYDADSTITLAAKPAEGYGFDRWSGDVTGTSATVTLHMTGAKNVVAHFIQR